MPSLFLLVLLMTGHSIASEVEEGEIIYSSADSLHDLEDGGPESPSKSHHLKLESLEEEDTPLVVIQPSQEIADRSDDDIVKDIVELIQAVSSSGEEEGSSPKLTSREAKQLNLGATGRIRSLFNIPFNHGQGFVPRTPLGSNIFSSINFNNPATGWQQRFKNTFSNLFSFGSSPNQMLPYGGIGMAASTNNPSFLPYPQQGHVNYNPYMQPPHAQNMWHQFQASQPQQMEDLSNAASYGHPTRLQLGNTFNPFNIPQQQFVPQQQFGADLAMSGSGISPHQAMQAANFGRYVSTVPRHVPLFHGSDLKSASMEMSNAFADFADSKEHGPDVTQKFGSVGHTVSTFLGMMGLGAHGGIMPGDDGYASIDSSPISRSMDFYPGYGNQAVLEEMGDFPIFQEDITREYLTRMNLTHLLDHVSIYEKEQDSPGNVDNETTYLEIIAKEPEMEKDTNIKYVLKQADVNDFKAHTPEKALYNFFKDPIVHDEPWYASAQHFDNKKIVETQEKGEKQVNKQINNDKETHKLSTTEDKKLFAVASTKRPWLINGKPKSSENVEKESADHKISTNSNSTKEADITPIVSYKVPPTHTPVAPKDRIPPVATFQGFPPRTDSVPKDKIPPALAAFQGFPTRSDADMKAPEPPKYAPAQSLPHRHEFEENPNRLVDDNVPRSWVEVSSGHGYVEKRPKQIYEINPEEIPKGMSIVHQMLSGISQHESLQE